MTDKENSAALSQYLKGKQPPSKDHAQKRATSNQSEALHPRSSSSGPKGLQPSHIDVSDVNGRIIGAAADFRQTYSSQMH